MQYAGNEALGDIWIARASVKFLLGPICYAGRFFVPEGLHFMMV